MPTDRIHETAATQRGGIGRTLPVTVLNDNGTTATVQAQDTGLYLTKGDIATVPSTAVKSTAN
jgi:hypothetical protein